MADTLESRMNLSAIKRVDPYVKDIIDNASHVALYLFNREDNKWEKTEIEGALFLYSRNGQPEHSIVVLNRLNTKSLVEPVTSKLDLQLQAPFLLYRNSRYRIYGIWFYEKEECIRIATLFKKLIEELAEAESVPSLPQIVPNPVSTPSSTGVDIYGMLTKAQENFKNASTVPKPVPPDVTSQSVMDFFAKASGGAKNEPFLQQIFNNPVHSVEHIEKQVRTTTPAAADPIKEEMPIIVSNLSLVESGLARLQTTPEQKPHPPVNVQALPSPSVRQNTVAPALMPPTMFTSPSVRIPSGPVNPSSTGVIDPAPEPLTRNQFLQAFSHMLRNDPDFVTKLHEAYVKSFSELVS